MQDGLGASSTDVVELDGGIGNAAPVGRDSVDIELQKCVLRGGGISGVVGVDWPEDGVTSSPKLVSGFAASTYPCSMTS